MNIKGVSRTGEFTATVGDTADFVTSGVALPGFRTFNDAATGGLIANGDWLPLTIENGVDFEIGLFQYAAPATFDRGGSRIYASSNSGSAVDWGAGNKRIYCSKIGELASLENILHNLTAVTDPGVGDDELDWYTPMSMWFNGLTGDLFVCIDAAAGAAVWKQFTLT